MKIVWTSRSISDLLEIGRFIAKHNVAFARQWVGRLKLKAHDAVRNPRAGRRVPEIDQDDIREILLKSYRIVYRVHKKHIEILTVFEGHRLIPISRSTKSDNG